MLTNYNCNHNRKNKYKYICIHSCSGTVPGRRQRRHRAYFFIYGFLRAGATLAETGKEKAADFCLPLLNV